jgi:hypothetical protein
MARYLCIERDAKEQLNLAEIEVYALENNVEVLKIPDQVTASSILPGYPASNLIDGIYNNFAHTFGTQPNAPNWFCLDFGKEIPVSQVLIYNRSDCCDSRVIFAQVSLRNLDNNVVWKKTIRYPFAQRIYTFFPGISASD